MTPPASHHGGHKKAQNKGQDFGSSFVHVIECLTSALNFSWVNTEQWVEIGAPLVLGVFDPVGLGQVAGITKKKTLKMVKYRVKKTATGMRTLP